MLAIWTASPRGAESGPPYMYWCISIVLVGPFAEEWVCRGILWQAVRRLFRPFLAICITATVFTLSHGLDRIREFPYLLGYGLLLGWLRHKCGSLSPTILAHSVTNLGLTFFPPLPPWR
jgi:membrane protease YdiL (CAAX protease family)